MRPASLDSKINVLIVDDSAVVRQILSDQFRRHPAFGTVDTAIDPYMAREKIAAGEFHVLTLDVEMPRMDGLTFLRHLMRSHPLPVVVLSALTDAGSEAALEALELGAVDVVTKPGSSFTVEEVVPLMIEKVIAASRVVHFASLLPKVRPLAGPTGGASTLSRLKTTNRIIGLGASTGGPAALEQIITAFDEDIPPTAVVIHMPPGFTRSYAQRLDNFSRVHVVEAEDGMLLPPGTVAVAPGNYHLTIKASGKDFVCRLGQGPRILGQRPAVDVLFHSLAECAGRNAIAALLTGMGKDGAQGLLQIRSRGGVTIAQDEASSIVFGMPREAIELGAAQKIASLDRIQALIEAEYRHSPVHSAGGPHGNQP